MSIETLAKVVKCVQTLRNIINIEHYLLLNIINFSTISCSVYVAALNR